MRLDRTIILATMAGSLIFGVPAIAQQHTTPEADANRSTTTEVVIRETKAEMPGHARYVDDQGNFDKRQAAKDIYDAGGHSAPDAVQRAQEMRREWLEAYNKKSTEVQSRL